MSSLLVDISFYDSSNGLFLPSLRTPLPSPQALLESGPSEKASILPSPVLWSSTQEIVSRFPPWCKPCAKQCDKASQAEFVPGDASSNPRSEHTAWLSRSRLSEFRDPFLPSLSFQTPLAGWF